MQKIYAFLSLATVALPALANYDINFPADTKIADRESRSITSVGIGDLIVEVPQATDKLLYHDFSSTAVFNVKTGAAVTPIINWNGYYMHGYFYADFNNNGTFEYPAELYSFSYYQGVNSLGLSVRDNCNVALHPFVIPGNMQEGDYRIRFIIDWDSCEPGGRCDEEDSIVKNAGAIVDATMRVEKDNVSGSNYALNYAADAQITHEQRRLHNINISQDLFGTQSVSVEQDKDKLLYHDCTDQKIQALPGAELQFNFDWTGTWMNSYVYIDRYNDGEFNYYIASEGVPVPGADVVAYSHYNGKDSKGKGNNGEYLNNIPSFKLPADLMPGKYRCRAKIDWNSTEPGGGEDIIETGGSITDFTLHVVGDDVESVSITLMPLNGMITLANGKPVPANYAEGYGFDIKAVASLPGFETDHIIVRHGTEENPTDTELAIATDGTVSIPGELIHGNVIIYALFEEQPDSEWTKIWGDEFNGDALDKTTWRYQPRYSATWNRYCAQGDAESEAVNTFGNGYYNSWCIPTDKEKFPDETEEMISGAINTNGKFHFHYGRIEARIKTNPYRGNFPAFWLMPETNAEGGWPQSGEIDIWEQIDANNQAHGTVHTGWTGWNIYCNWPEAPKVGSPANTGNVAVDDMYTWHYYALEWTAEELTWYVDGKESFSYKNMHYSEPNTNYTEQICWPFYKDFYVILNQSVGNGAWAAWADITHTYLTQFDYVRAYQKKGEKTYTSPLKGNGDDPGFYIPLTKDSINEINSNGTEVNNAYYDLQGRRINKPVKGRIYITNNKKILF